MESANWRFSNQRSLRHNIYRETHRTYCWIPLPANHGAALLLNLYVRHAIWGHTHNTGEDTQLGLLQWKYLVSTGDRKLFDRMIFLQNIFSFPLSSYIFLFLFSISTFGIISTFPYPLTIPLLELFPLSNYFHFSISASDVFPLFYVHF